MPKIRQEINILNRQIASTGTAFYPDECCKIVASELNGKTGYFEVIYKNLTGSVANLAVLQDDVGPPVSGAIFAASEALPAATVWTRHRFASSITFSDTLIYWGMYMYNHAANDFLVKSAKIIILQDATDITATQTQIEVGAYEEFDYTDTANYALVEPKYWRYEASKWDPTPTFHFACTTMEGEMSACNYYLQEASDAGFTSNLSVVATISAVENSTPTYHESTSFTPTDGYFYRVQFSQSSARKGGIIYNAKVIATQTSIESHPTSYYSNNYAFNGNWTGFGQSFESKDTQYINSVKFYLKIGAGSPTGTLVAKLYAHTGTFGTSSLPTGAALATSETIDASTITGSYVLYEFTFLTPYQLSASTYYVVTVEYTGGGPINYLHVGYDESATEHPGNLCRDDSGWGAQADDIIFYVYFSPISKLQPEYLLINEAQTDTGLQEFMTYFDPAEWDGVDNDYYHEHSADSASSNTKLQGIIELESNEAAYTDRIPCYGATGTGEAVGMSFYTPNDGINHVLRYIDIEVDDTGAPTDNLYMEVAASIDGAAIDTSGDVDSTPLSDGQMVRFSFTGAASLTANTKYYMRLFRDGARSTANYISWRHSGSQISGIGAYVKNSGSWGSETETADCNFIVYGVDDITNSDITGDDLTRGGSALTMPTTAKEIDSYIVTA